jgi:hypothetical protein
MINSPIIETLIQDTEADSICWKKTDIRMEANVGTDKRSWIRLSMATGGEKRISAETKGHFFENIKSEEAYSESLTDTPLARLWSAATANLRRKSAAHLAE